MTMNCLFDGSDAHLLPADAGDCAAKLREFNRWRRGAEDAAEPHPAEIGLLIDFAAEVLDAMASHGHLMVIASTRYCIGRQTYIVGDCASWLTSIWSLLSHGTQTIIKRDVEEAFSRDDEDRAENRNVKALGSDFDRAQWERVRQLWKTENEAAHA